MVKLDNIVHKIGTKKSPVYSGQFFVRKLNLLSTISRFYKALKKKGFSSVGEIYRIFFSISSISRYRKEDSIDCTLPLLV
jgi:hypothetical protein